MSYTEGKRYYSNPEIIIKDPIIKKIVIDKNLIENKDYCNYCVDKLKEDIIKKD